SGALSPRLIHRYRHTSKTLLFSSSSSISSSLSSQPFQNTPRHNEALRALQKQYNTKTISNIAGILRPLNALDYDTFETTETFQQRFTNLTNYRLAKTPEDALQAISAGLLLNAVERSDLSVQASLENNINSKPVPEGQSSTQHIFHPLSS